MLSFKGLAPAALALLVMTTVPALAEDAAKTAPAQAAKGTETTAAVAPSSPVATVNGVAITRRELDQAVKVLLMQNQVPESAMAQVREQATAAALEQLISAQLIYEQAQKVEVKDLDKKVEEKLAQSKSRFATDEEYKKALSQVGLTPQDMQDFTRKDITIANFIDTRFASQAAVTDAEAQEFYKENLDAYFKKPESAHASHILIGADEKATPEDRKKAKEKAEAILKRVKAGEDFAALAKAESSCPSAAQGGDLGEFTRGQMVPQFDEAVFSMKPGEISNVVETTFGYHIIKLVEKKEGKTEKFEDVKEKIISHLKRQKVQKALSSFLEDLKKNAKIVKS
ncbi:peptidylprolyl isomerase [Geomonas sp. Red32]|uniref:peptidylprolyl isomerase n=1 Tax=Geomonas sp. Red32 TaxID=2912856 RepID=UPI00202CAA25|nr:peptidylprolyl isomerase [Geomonas sp. Red32]MCM0081744.1 peptidylprolyl isomerase [Geomonas sp. Red32]